MRMTRRLFIVSIFALALLVHVPALFAWYIQDDSQAILDAQNWRAFYAGIDTLLQYRPNAYVITHMLDTLLPREPWVYRLYGILTIALCALCGALLCRRLTGDDRLAMGAGLWLVTAPAFYAYTTIYLTASMTGLGLIFLILTLWHAHRAATGDSRHPMAIMSALCVLGLASYEIYIIAMPLAFLIDRLWRRPYDFVQAAKLYALPALLTLGYLVARSNGIESGLQDARSASLYGLGIGPHVFGNTAFQLANGLGVAQLRQVFDPLFIVIPAYIALLVLAWRAPQRRVFILCAAWLVIGLLPFIFGIFIS